MFRKKEDKPQSRIDSLIGPGTRIEGDVSFSGGLRVDGHVRGNVIATGDEPSTLMLSDQGNIEGRIQVSHAIINGTVIGSIHANGYLELQAKARVSGDVYYKTMEIQLGAAVEAKLLHQDNIESEKVVALKSVASD